MILKTNNNVESNIDFSEFEQKEFDIEVNGKMFDLLSSKIYENPIRAIVRELSCNAIDAHIEKGIFDPIEVYLPTREEPTLIVKDFGIGMSEEELFSVYSSYGCSTKSHTNDLIGSLGLGSKTPLAYTSQFNVSSSKDGIKTNCLIFKNDDGKPQIMKLSSENTNDSGTTIEVPIQKEDVYKFIEAAYMSFIFFKNVPEIKRNEEKFYSLDMWAEPGDDIEKFRDLFFAINQGINEKEFIDTDYLFDLNYKFVKNIFDYYNTNLGIVMGSIFYTIDPKIVFGDMPQGSYLFGNTQHYRIIQVPLGSVSIQASREALSYNNSTISFLQEKFLQPVKTFAKKVEASPVEEILKNLEEFNLKNWSQLRESDHNPDYVNNIVKKFLLSLEEVFLRLLEIKENTLKQGNFIGFCANLNSNILSEESIKEILLLLSNKDYSGIVVLDYDTMDKFCNYMSKYWQKSKKLPSYYIRIFSHYADILGKNILLLYSELSSEVFQTTLKVPAIDISTLETSYKEFLKNERIKKASSRKINSVNEANTNCILFASGQENPTSLGEKSMEELKKLSTNKSVAYIVYSEGFKNGKIFDPDFVNLKKVSKNKISSVEFYFSWDGKIPFVKSADYIAYITQETFLSSEIWSWENCYYIKDWFIKEFVDNLIPLKTKIESLKAPHNYYCSNKYDLKSLASMLPDLVDDYPRLKNTLFYKHYEEVEKNNNLEKEINKVMLEFSNLKNCNLLFRGSTLIPEYSSLASLATDICSSLQDTLNGLTCVDHYDEFIIRYPMMKYFMERYSFDPTNIKDVINYVLLIEKDA